MFFGIGTADTKGFAIPTAKARVLRSPLNPTILSGGERKLPASTGEIFNSYTYHFRWNSIISQVCSKNRRIHISFPMELQESCHVLSFSTTETVSLIVFLTSIFYQLRVSIFKPVKVIFNIIFVRPIMVFSTNFFILVVFIQYYNNIKKHNAETKRNVYIDSVHEHHWLFPVYHLFLPKAFS